MSARKITIITHDESYDDADIIGMIYDRLGSMAKSVMVESVANNAVLYVDVAEDRRRYLLAVSSSRRTVDWTDDIDSAKVCDGPNSIAQTKAEAERICAVKLEILPV